MPHTITAVHDDDLTEFLKSVGLLRDLERGILHCAYCGEGVNFENLYAVYPSKHEIQVACDRPSCVKALHSALYNH